ncbi:MAG: hypothetical protein BRC52_02455 [Cyanobacteria bacterium SW_5_48_44]|nr:MAG: hypothetical protein BRC52_02455 [Cyanobacteria bacterium SW_5_48_44]
MLAMAAEQEQGRYGSHCQGCIDSAHSVTRMLGSVQTGVAREAASSVAKTERKKKRHREGHGWRITSPA